ncbi:alpha/beta-hydrolase family protein [Methyloligella sp. 2.7D]|uniref:alpha/beta hydrolase n=1 Tax=unclassified Methyloligella TaxID=2625955 RepID=UPI00157CE107|nr:alpha/beta-hydrolase family protein [Methyloligella sp. GL2]QKP78439.1 alpha/beta-hydrolase family protein [Methyloligella sp. GL2]
MTDKKRPRAKSQTPPWWLPSFTGLFLGFLFFVLTFTPSLIPRPPLFQGLLGGLAFFIGYAIGHGTVLLWRYLELPEVPAPWRRGVNIVLGLACVIAAALYIPRATAWQDNVRALLNMPPAEPASVVQMIVIAVLVAVLLMLLLRGLVAGFSAASALVYRWVPRRIAGLLGAVIFAVLLVTLVNGTLISATITAIDKAQALTDIASPPGAVIPTEKTRSGGPGSKIAWQDLGRAGKRFVTEGPRKEEIEAFTGRPALEPIRVYAGLRAADSPEEQAGLALADLIEMGAFGRSILVIATPTGTGWIDNNGIAPLEVMHDGDVATVAVQYSYLQSPLSLILEPGRSQDSAAEVFRVIYRYWQDLPEDSRPKLYLFGLSLGSLGSESSPPMYAWLGDSFDGAVWTGPPFRNRIWRGIQRDREDGSPAWRPVFEDGANFRVIGHGDSAEEAAADWGRVRIVYIAYPSDAIAFFEESMLYQQPQWMSPPRGTDVSPLLQWFPIVTALQVGIDMIFAAEVPPGHGHDYAAADYIEAWKAVSAPEDWTEEDATRLATELQKRAEKNSSSW